MMERLLEKYIDIVHDETGQGMVEYALILAFVVAVAGVALVATGGLGLDLKTKLDGIL